MPVPFRGGASCRQGLLLSYSCDVDQQYDVHHQGVEDGGDGHFFACEDDRAGGDGDSLGCVLHADFDGNGAALLRAVFHQTGKKGGASDGDQDTKSANKFRNAQKSNC